MDDLDKIKEKRKKELEEQLQQSHQQQAQEQDQFEQQIHQLESIVKTAMTKDALVRYGNLKTAHQEKAVQLLVILAKAIQSGQITTITDQQLKELLQKLTPQKRDIKIRRV